MEPRTRICPDCGSDIPATNADCPYCGAPAPSPSASSAATVSFAERYGVSGSGAAGAATPDGTAAVGADPRRLRWRRLAIAGGGGVAFLALLLALGAASGVLSLGGTPAPSPSLAAATPAPEPTGPSPAQVLGAFTRLVARRDLAYHLEWSGATTTGGKTRTFDSSLDVSGTDYAGTVTSGGQGTAASTRIAYVDGVLYTKVGTKPWAKRRTSDERFQQWPLLGLGGPYDLAPAGTMQRDGETLLVLRSTSNYHPNRERMLGLAAIRPATDSLVLEVYVRETGMPVAATFRLQAGGVARSGAPVFSGTADYVFSRIGEAITVAAPSK